MNDRALETNSEDMEASFTCSGTTSESFLLRGTREDTFLEREDRSLAGEASTVFSWDAVTGLAIILTTSDGLIIALGSSRDVHIFL